MADDDHLADQERCMKLAAPLLPEFYQAWHAAFARYLKYPAEITAEHDDTTAANCIRAALLAEITRRFNGRKGFKLLRYRRLWLLNHRDQTLWRFKQVDGSGRHQNVQTVQQRRFDLQLPLPGLPAEAVRLTSGYEPDAARQSIQRVIVSRPYGKSMRWAAQVNMMEGAATWTDITPARFFGTERFDYRTRRADEQ